MRIKQNKKMVVKRWSNTTPQLKKKKEKKTDLCKVLNCFNLRLVYFMVYILRSPDYGYNHPNFSMPQTAPTV